MAIKRAKRETNFTMMSNVGLRDKRLSFKAKGLLAYMLSLPDDWVFYEEEITKHSTDGKQSVRTGLKELQEFGYLIKNQSREKGKFAKVDWLLYDEPGNVDIQVFLPKTEKRSTDNPPTENQPLLSTNVTKDLNKQIKTANQDLLVVDFKKLWKLYPNKKGNKETALKAYKKALKGGTTNKQIQDGIVAYKKHLAENDWLKPAFGSTWFFNCRWNDEYEEEKKSSYYSRLETMKGDDEDFAEYRRIQELAARDRAESD